MPHVRVTRHLLRYFSGLAEHSQVEGRTVAAVLATLDARHPGLAAYIVDERGALRKHVNIFIGSERIRDRNTLSDPVNETDTLHILQALSGG